MIPFINSIFIFFAWIAMLIKDIKHFWPFLVGFFLLCVALPGCGTGIGNPGAAAFGDSPGDSGIPLSTPYISGHDFDGPITYYNNHVLFGIPPENPTGSPVNCGAYDNSSLISEIATGRKCVEDALAVCQTADYLFDQTNNAGQRFVAYVGIEVDPVMTKTCNVFVYVVSTDSNRFLGKATSRCSSLSTQYDLELSCLSEDQILADKS